MPQVFSGNITECVMFMQMMNQRGRGGSRRRMGGRWRGGFRGRGTGGFRGRGGRGMTRIRGSGSGRHHRNSNNLSVVNRHDDIAVYDSNVNGEFNHGMEIVEDQHDVAITESSVVVPASYVPFVSAATEKSWPVVQIDTQKANSPNSSMFIPSLAEQNADMTVETNRKKREEEKKRKELLLQRSV